MLKGVDERGAKGSGEGPIRRFRGGRPRRHDDPDVYKRQMGTWKAPAVLWVAYTLLAYAFSFVVYRTALWVCG